MFSFPEPCLHHPGKGGALTDSLQLSSSSWGKWALICSAFLLLRALAASAPHWVLLTPGEGMGKYGAGEPHVLPPCFTLFMPGGSGGPDPC